MLEVRRDANLGQEAFGAELGRELGIEHLERDGAFVPEIAREIHRRHSAGADLTFDLIPARKRGVELGDRFHGGAGVANDSARTRPPTPPGRSHAPSTAVVVHSLHAGYLRAARHL